MKWTRSVDGELRTNVRVSYRVDRTALVLAAMHELAHLNEVASRRELETALRKLLRRVGDSWPFAAEKLDLEEVELDALAARAEAIVNRLFPELGGEVIA